MRKSSARQTAKSTKLHQPLLSPAAGQWQAAQFDFQQNYASLPNNDDLVFQQQLEEQGIHPQFSKVHHHSKRVVSQQQNPAMAHGIRIKQSSVATKAPSIQNKRRNNSSAQLKCSTAEPRAQIQTLQVESLPFHSAVEADQYDLYQQQPNFNNFVQHSSLVTPQQHYSGGPPLGSLPSGGMPVGPHQGGIPAGSLLLQQDSLEGNIPANYFQPGENFTISDQIQTSPSNDLTRFRPGPQKKIKKKAVLSKPSIDSSKRSVEFSARAHPVAHTCGSRENSLTNPGNQAGSLPRHSQRQQKGGRVQITVKQRHLKKLRQPSPLLSAGHPQVPLPVQTEVSTSPIRSSLESSRRSQRKHFGKAQLQQQQQLQPEFYRQQSDQFQGKSSKGARLSMRGNKFRQVADQLERVEPEPVFAPAIQQSRPIKGSKIKVQIPEESKGGSVFDSKKAYPSSTKKQGSLEAQQSQREPKRCKPTSTDEDRSAGPSMPHQIVQMAQVPVHYAAQSQTPSQPNSSRSVNLRNMTKVANSTDPPEVLQSAQHLAPTEATLTPQNQRNRIVNNNILMTKITELEESQEFSAAGSSKKALPGHNFRKILKQTDPTRLAQVGGLPAGSIEQKHSQIVANEMKKSIFKRNEEKQQAAEAMPERQIQKIKLKISKLTQAKKYSTPVENVSESSQVNSVRLSRNQTPLGKLEEMKQSDGKKKRANSSPRQSSLLQNHPPALQEESEELKEEQQISSKRDSGDKLTSSIGAAQGESQVQVRNFGPQQSHLLNFNSPTSIKIIDLKQPKVRKLLMESLQEIVKERKTKFHQKEARDFNHNYNQIIKNTLQNKTLKVENSLANQINRSPNHLSEADPPLQQIISRPEFSMRLAEEEGNRASNQHVPSHDDPGLLGVDLRLLEEQQQARNHQGRMTPRQQMRLIQRLNEIFEEQETGHQTNSSSKSVHAADGGLIAERPLQEDEECQIFSAINNECLLYIANSTHKQSEIRMSQEKPSIEKFSSPAGSQSQISLSKPQDIRQQVDTQAMFQDLACRLQDIQNLQKICDRSSSIPGSANFSRNNFQLHINMNMVDQVSTQERNLIFEQADLQRRQLWKQTEEPNYPLVTKVPSANGLTFFDLSNPLHLNQLFGRLEEIQQQESSTSGQQRELPKVVANLPAEPAEEVEEEKKEEISKAGGQSGDGSSCISSVPAKTPIHSRQGIEQHQIDVDQLIQKLLQIPNVDVLDSIFNVDDGSQIFNIDLQPSNGTNDRSAHTTSQSANVRRESENSNQTSGVAQSVGAVPALVPAALDRDKQEERKEGTMSSGGRASEIQSSGIMTPKSQHSLSTPNQIRMLQERSFNAQGGVPAHMAAVGAQVSGPHDLMSPFTKRILMQKLKEVKEQTSDNSDSSDEVRNDLINPMPLPESKYVDGVVAGSIPDPKIFANVVPPSQKRSLGGQSFYDQSTGSIIQKALDTDEQNRNRKTKIIISRIDEEEETLQNEEDAEFLEEQRKARGQHTKLNSLVSPSPISVHQPAFQANQVRAFTNQIPQGDGPNSQPSIDLLIQKLKKLESQQRQIAERNARPVLPNHSSHDGSVQQAFDPAVLTNRLNELGSLQQKSGSNSPLKVGNISIYNMTHTLKKLEKNHQHRVSEQNIPTVGGMQPQPLGDDCEEEKREESIVSRNHSVANILEQVIKRLELLKSRDNSAQ